MTEHEAGGLLGSAFLWRAVALASGGAGAFLLATGAGPPSLSILLLVAALAASGVLLGSGPYGPSVEGRLDLSARLGLGLLGGVLGAAISALVRSGVVELGLAEALRVSLSGGWTGPDFLAHLGSGAVWGMVLGVLFEYVPGRSGSARGALFSLAPTLYLLFKVYPFDRDLGLLGVELGMATFLFVFGLNLVWGMIAGATLGWGEVTDETPVARPIDA